MSGVKQTVEGLLKESAERAAEALRLESLLREYPDLKRFEGRWKKVVFFSKAVNDKVTAFDQRHNCGCCSDSPLEIWPYVETSNGRVYSDPASFTVGERGPYSGDVPSEGWDSRMRAAGIPEGIVARVQAHFEACAEAARDSIDEAYGG